MIKNRLLLLSTLVVLSLGGCASTSRQIPEAISLLGKPLYAPELERETLLDRSNKLVRAQIAYERDPAHEMSTVWFGRRLAYLGRYHQAIEIFSQGLVHHPESHRLYRHRGHRHLSIRKLDAAIEDLTRAAQLIEGVADEIEMDGLPNSKNIPTSTTHTNIYYHLALAHYLKGQWEKSRQGWVKCLEFSKNDDMHCAATYWLYLSLRRLGLDEVANAALDDISADMEIIENFAYHRLLLLFKGELTLDDFPEGDDALENTTTAYGLGAWRLINGKTAEAREVFQKIEAGEQWAAFGYIAAEAELAGR